MLGLPVHDAVLLRVDGHGGGLDERSVRVLPIALRLPSLLLQRNRVFDDVLEQCQHTRSTTGTFLVGFEVRGRRLRASEAQIHLHECGRVRCIPQLQDMKSLFEQILCRLLIRDSAIKLRLLLLPVLLGLLELLLELGNLSLQAQDGLLQSLLCPLQPLQLRVQVLLRVQLLGGPPLVLIQLVGARVTMLDVLLILLQELGNHVSDGFLHTRERVKLHRARQRRQSREPLIIVR
mmetsp:Transcript_73897/g.187408  ORF Transcript_73897/g.187408 Transcript_73897/m.187408 type:complete len:234 (-) Transcript_73897:577-1278(-)